jgi:hypothetical protein
MDKSSFVSTSPPWNFALRILFCRFFWLNPRPIFFSCWCQILFVIFSSLIFGHCFDHFPFVLYHNVLVLHKKLNLQVWIPMSRSLLDGIEHLNFCLVPNNMVLVLMYGLQVVYLQSYLIADHSYRWVDFHACHKCGFHSWNILFIVLAVILVMQLAYSLLCRVLYGLNLYF